VIPTFLHTKSQTFPFSTHATIRAKTVIQLLYRYLYIRTNFETDFSNGGVGRRRESLRVGIMCKWESRGVVRFGFGALDAAWHL
jgi:hypothetical protein